MIRPILTEVGIFLIPFVLFAISLVLSRKKVFERKSWPVRVFAWLAIAGFILTIISLVMFAHLSGNTPDSTYVPATMEDGKLLHGDRK